MENKTIHPIEVTTIKGEKIKLEEYKGKVLLIVNTASQCGFTPQLHGMESLYQTYKDQGFELLAFPSNDFMGQEPLEGEEIEQFCMLKYDASYPIFDKSKVTGRNASDLFQFLSEKSQNGRFNAKPRWNFQKYLINQEGALVNYFYSFTKPESNKIKKAIEALLK